MVKILSDSMQWRWLVTSRWALHVEGILSILCRVKTFIFPLFLSLPTRQASFRQPFYAETELSLSSRFCSSWLKGGEVTKGQIIWPPLTREIESDTVWETIITASLISRTRRLVCPLPPPPPLPSPARVLCLALVSCCFSRHQSNAGWISPSLTWLFNCS